jgi:N-acetylglucosaminyl-diphospho-decaprenol L-rhamnosyltransferase
MVLNFDLLGHCPQFDDVYFLYYEDCDLCERYFQQGYVIAATSVPLVIHAVSRITSRYPQPKFAYATFSKLTFIRRHATPLALWLNLAYLFAQSLWLALSDRAAAQGRWLGLRRFLTQRR